MYLKKESKGSIQRFLEEEIFGISRSKSRKKKSVDNNSQNQINNELNNEFFIDFENLLRLSFFTEFFSKYSSFDLAIFSIFVFFVEIFICISFFSFESYYFALIILFYYNLLIAILLRIIVYKEIKNFNEFFRWLVNVAPFGLIFPFVSGLAIFAFVIIFIMAIIIVLLALIRR